MSSPVGARRPPGRPAQISRELIVEAVSSIENVDTLTMRELAGKLDVTHSALYRWVKNRDELFDLISEILVDRILRRDEPEDASWQVRLTHIARRIHDQFLAVPGYATHLSRPHAHTAHSTTRLRTAIVAVFVEAGVDAYFAEQSYYIFMTAIVSWLAVEENPLHLGSSAPRFDLFLDTLLRGLPARERGTAQP